MNDDLVEDMLVGLQSRWGITAHRVTPVEDGKRYFTIEAGVQHWILKLREITGETLADVVHGLKIQHHLNEIGFPTPSIQMTVDGDVVASLDGYTGSLEKWVAPSKVPLDLDDWEAFGRVVGQLHTLGSLPDWGYRASRLDPRRTLASSIAGVSRQVVSTPSDQQEVLKGFLRKGRQLTAFDDLPRVLIHSDLCWNNIVRTEDSGLVVVDFEGAGIGPAIMDLVEVTTQLCTGPGGSGPLDEGAAVSFYRGYRQHRGLSKDELNALPEAHFYHQLFFLNDSVGRGDFPYIDRMQGRLDWWERDALPRLTAIAAS